MYVVGDNFRVGGAYKSALTSFNVWIAGLSADAYYKHIDDDLVPF
jgi:hypothetical protein